MKRDESSSSTRERILAAACRLFAARGYHGVGVTRICAEAGANIAAISYYFGGKESLYQEAWRHAHAALLAAVPATGGVDASRPAAERLRGRIRAAVQRAMVGDAVEFGIMRSEMANPTGLLDRVIEDSIRPLREATQAILRDLLGPGCTALDLKLCEVCVVSPWMHLIHRRQAEKHKGLAPVFGEENLEAMVEHFTAYALAGVEATRQRIEQRPGGQADGQ